MRSRILLRVAGLLVIAALALGAGFFLYRYGKSRGVADERARAFSKEGAVPAPAVAQLPETESTLADEAVVAGGAPAAESAQEAGVPAITLLPTDCARVTWPMELLPADEAVDHPYFRLREGAGRLMAHGQGVCEFVFQARKCCNVAVYIHCRGNDECSNSLLLQLNGSFATYVDMGEEYGQWRWRPSYRRFGITPGLQRLTLRGLEDGVEIDRVVVSSSAKLDAVALDAAPHKEPPRFERYPETSPTLPEIGRVCAQAFASRSLVVASGRENRVTVFLRLNGKAETSGTICAYPLRGGESVSGNFSLTKDKRYLFQEFPLKLERADITWLPVMVEVRVGKEKVLVQQLDFVAPLDWAFLGPFEDPEGKGLRAQLPPEQDLDGMRRLRDCGGKRWKTVTDGSCYNDLGVVDLNRVFGLVPHREQGQTPLVAYAFTRVWHMPDHHLSLRFGADDSLKVWHNGRALLAAYSACPLELSRQVLGIPMTGGATGDDFAFKITQTSGYWQLDFATDNSTPYGLGSWMRPVRLQYWPRDGKAAAPPPTAVPEPESAPIPPQ